MNITHAQSSAFLSVRGLSKAFGRYDALTAIDLDVRQGELLSFLGPSGCGKSTLLRIIMGLERQNAGSVHHAGRDISHLSASERGFGILFQSYALFPNLTVRGNIAYGLRRPAREARPRIAELLELTDLVACADKYPSQLSGGQQQRAALARALAPQPRLLLLDEPLSALDAKVRVRLRDQIKSLQRRLGLTAIMVTHDQEEALAMADRIVVMNRGRVEQIGTPQEIYGRPASLFVAGFVGRMNMLPGVVRAGVFRPDGGSAAIGLPHECGEGRARLCIRPEDIEVTSWSDGGGDLHAEAKVVDLEFLGPFTRLNLSVSSWGSLRMSIDVSARQMRGLSLAQGSMVGVRLDRGRIQVIAGA